MKGLLIKDFKLLKNQLNFFIVICVIGILVMFTQGNAFFLISYCSLIFSMFTLSTISYDEFDNGAAFLFTLPISRKMYVTEKFAFGILTSVGIWTITVVISGVVMMVKEPGTDLVEFILAAVMMLFIPIFILALTIPVQLKFGAEKGRIAMFGVMGVVAVLVFVAVQISKALGITLDTINNLSTAGLAGMSGVIAVVCIILWLISYGISVKIMEKKQF